MKVSTPPPSAESRLQHAAGFYGSTHHLVGQLIPLVEAGLRRDEQVVVSLDDATDRVLREAVDRPDLLGGIPRPRGPDSCSGQTVALRRARELRELTGRVGPVTLLTEHCAALDGADGAFWTEFDAAVNVALAGVPVRLICFFPELPLHQAVLDGALDNHPQLLIGGELRHNAAHRQPREVLARHPAAAPILLGAPDLRIAFRAWQLQEVRRAVGVIADAVGFTVDRTEDVVLAVNEVATNAVEHGSREAELYIWAEPDALVCEVHDLGTLHDPLPGLHPPHPSDPRGRGLWIARQICDLLHVWTDGRGTHVRVRAVP